MLTTPPFQNSALRKMSSLASLFIPTQLLFISGTGRCCVGIFQPAWQQHFHLHHRGWWRSNLQHRRGVRGDLGQRWLMEGILFWSQVLTAAKDATPGLKRIKQFSQLTTSWSCLLLQGRRNGPYPRGTQRSWRSLQRGKRTRQLF